MREDFLSFVWQYQLFDKLNLETTEHRMLEVATVGQLNTDAGPDFFNVHVKIDGLEWVGNVEIHMKSSEWYAHGHNRDDSYDNVVLHVVWEDNHPVKDKHGHLVPTLEMKSRVDENLVNKYREMKEREDLPCSVHLDRVPDIQRIALFDKALVKRLENKASEIRMLFEASGRDWQETAYQVLAQGFGFNVNKIPFLHLSRSLPYKYLLKHRDHLFQLEALLFGQAGFLEEEPQDDYQEALKNEYEFLSKKYALAKDHLDKVEWKFLRMRPTNFPSLRIAQFATFLHQSSNLLALFFETEDVKVLGDLFALTPSEYWQSHYRFGKSSSKPVPALGKSSVDVLLINTLAPLLTAYGKLKEEYEFLNRAQDLLTSIPPENNKYIRLLEQGGFSFQHAFDTQAGLEVYRNFCEPRRCLSCNIGLSLMRKD